MANIHQVAKHAGVSVATVSRVLNGQNSVTAKTRIKVEDAIKQLNYEPSLLGRNLRNSESRLLLVLIPNISNPFYSEIINGIENTAIDLNYNILLCETDTNPDRENIYFDLVRKKMADGIISMDPAVNVETLTKLGKTHAIIQCSEYAVDSGIPYVTIDNLEAAYRAVKHLIRIGHTRIALINSDQKYLYARQRQLGYQKALEEHGLHMDEELIFHTQGLGFEYGQQAMKKVLSQKQRPTAIFAVSDLLAIGALKEIHSHSLKVPEDIAVVGFDKIAFSNMTHPTLTTVAQPMYQMGTIAAKMLVDKIQGKEVESLILDHELVIRESTLG
ncbi:LacI family DNA-binding transcriptional regulator [Sediminibacillus albus]|uniref:Alanine racemase n=1 Tax=Sediminibacillus albus TaxID=407036 RepID=A0A1G8ZRP5_9BACI|nr:LacI family DNA-binding transcriptional regulator [Sediminibacillus albus]SDK17769.1 alanine racemase [Sediminibacillus albus]